MTEEIVNGDLHDGPPACDGHKSRLKDGFRAGFFDPQVTVILRCLWVKVNGLAIE